MVTGMTTVNLIRFDPTGAPTLTVGGHVYGQPTPGRAVRWTVTDEPDSNGSVRVRSDTGSECSVTPFTPWDNRWYVEDPEGEPCKVHEVAGHVVNVRVIVPVEEAATAEEAKKVAGGRVPDGLAWSAMAFSDQTWHVFDRDGWPAGESVPDYEVGAAACLGGTVGVGVGHAVYPGELSIRDCHRDLMSRSEVQERAVRRSGPAPDPALRARVVDGHARGLTYGQIAASTDVTRQRIAQVVKTLRRDAGAANFDEAPPTTDLVDLARFAVADEETHDLVDAAARRFLDRVKPLISV